MIRSPIRRDIGWRVPVIAVLMGVFLPMLFGLAVLYLMDAPLVGLPKDGSGRSIEQHLGFVAAALAAAPIIAVFVIPIAVILLKVLIQFGWAGPGSAVLLALGFGLPVAHWMLNGDVTTEDTSVLGHLLSAMVIQGLTGWAAMWVMLRKDS